MDQQSNRSRTQFRVDGAYRHSGLAIVSSFLLKETSIIKVDENRCFGVIMSPASERLSNLDTAILAVSGLAAVLIHHEQVTEWMNVYDNLYLSEAGLLVLDAVPFDRIERVITSSLRLLDVRWAAVEKSAAGILSVPDGASSLIKVRATRKAAPAKARVKRKS